MREKIRKRKEGLIENQKTKKKKKKKKRERLSLKKKAKSYEHRLIVVKKRALHRPRVIESATICIIASQLQECERSWLIVSMWVLNGNTSEFLDSPREISDKKSSNDCQSKAERNSNPRSKGVSLLSNEQGNLPMISIRLNQPGKLLNTSYFYFAIWLNLQLNFTRKTEFFIIFLGPLGLLWVYGVAAIYTPLLLAFISHLLHLISSYLLILSLMSEIPTVINDTSIRKSDSGSSNSGHRAPSSNPPCRSTTDCGVRGSAQNVLGSSEMAPHTSPSHMSPKSSQPPLCSTTPVSTSPSPHIDVIAPSLTEEEKAQYQNTVLFGRIWGEYVPSDAIVSRMTKEWSSGKGEVAISYAYNGWFRITFESADDKERVWEGRPWFVQGLNFVLKQWSPMFITRNQQITHIDQWVRIPFLPTEYWNYNHLSQIVKGIGTLIKFDKFTVQNSGVAQYARVCINLDITKLVPRFIKLNDNGTIVSFFLSYEGVHETCASCGSDNHHLKTCPNKQNSCLELVVAKLEASTLDQTEKKEEATQEWTSILPKRRSRPSLRGGKTKKFSSKPKKGGFGKEFVDGANSKLNEEREPKDSDNIFAPLADIEDLGEDILDRELGVHNFEGEDISEEFLTSVMGHSSPLGDLHMHMDYDNKEPIPSGESSKRRRRENESPSTSYE